MNVLISADAQQRGFFGALSKKFNEEGHSVVFLSQKKGYASVAKKSYQFADEITALDQQSITVNLPEEDQIYSVAKEFEEKYNINFAVLMAQDRGLGRGYLFNVDRYAQRYDAWLSNKKKCLILIEKILIYEYLIEKFKLDLAIQLFTGMLEDAVFNYHNVQIITVGFARCSNNNMLFHNSYLENKELLSKLNHFLDLPESLSDYKVDTLVQHKFSTAANSISGWTYIDALIKSFKMFKKEFRMRLGNFVRGRKADKESGYIPYAWIPSKFREVRNYKYIQKNSVRPEGLEGLKIVYFPLHLEPEVALMTISPEFSNSLEAISWISKSLPADYVLVVREYNLSFGVRSKWFYNTLLQIGNVRFAHPSVHSWDWIKKSVLVSTITGSVGFEGVYLRKPVLSYGKHQLINDLSTVEYASDFCSTKNAVKNLLSKKDGSEFELMHKALEKAISESSFNMEGFIDSYKDRKEKPEMANTCYQEILRYLKILQEDKG